MVCWQTLSRIWYQLKTTMYYSCPVKIPVSVHQNLLITPLSLDQLMTWHLRKWWLVSLQPNCHKNITAFLTGQLNQFHIYQTNGGVLIQFIFFQPTTEWIMENTPVHVTHGLVWVVTSSLTLSCNLLSPRIEQQMRRYFLLNCIYLQDFFPGDNLHIFPPPPKLVSLPVLEFS